MTAKAKCEKCGRTIPVSELLKHKCEGEVPKNLRHLSERRIGILRKLFRSRF
ncbi:MAG: hypothetical protein ACR2PE_03165 [Porticoccus sp.]